MAAANPGWEHRLYNSAKAERFIADHYGVGTLAAYLRIGPEYGAARADLLRYLVIYKHGGVYLDLQSGSGDLSTRLSTAMNNSFSRAGATAKAKSLKTLGCIQTWCMSKVENSSSFM